MVVRVGERPAAWPAVRADAVGERIGWPKYLPLATSSRYRIPELESILPRNVARFARRTSSIGAIRYRIPGIEKMLACLPPARYHHRDVLRRRSPSRTCAPLTRESPDRYPRRLEGRGVPQGVLAWVGWKRRSTECCEARRTRTLRFADLCALLRHLGFDERVRGSHHIFTRSEVVEILNLQPRGNQAKPYQVKQVRDVIACLPSGWRCGGTRSRDGGRRDGGRDRP